MKTIELPNLPVPPGATADDWSEPVAGEMARSLTWSRHDAAGVGVNVDGLQYNDGQVSRSISLYDTDKELTSADARALAAALLEAADEYDRLEKVHPIVREEA